MARLQGRLVRTTVYYREMDQGRIRILGPDWLQGWMHFASTTLTPPYLSSKGVFLFLSPFLFLLISSSVLLFSLLYN